MIPILPLIKVKLWLVLVVTPQTAPMNSIAEYVGAMQYAFREIGIDVEFRKSILVKSSIDKPGTWIRLINQSGIKKRRRLIAVILPENSKQTTVSKARFCTYRKRRGVIVSTGWDRNQLGQTRGRESVHALTRGIGRALCAKYQDNGTMMDPNADVSNLALGVLLPFDPRSVSEIYQGIQDAK